MLPAFRRIVQGVFALALVAALVALSACTGDDSDPVDATASSASDARELQTAVQSVVEAARPAVVQVSNRQVLRDSATGSAASGSDGLVPAGVGSGVIFDNEGHILTNNHVVEAATRLVVRLTDGREFEADLVGADPRTDLAVLQIHGDNLPVASTGTSSALQVGEWVVAIGNALGLVGGPTVTVGVVSAVGRTVQEPSGGTRAGSFLFDVIQTDAAINPGNSGGPLLNLDGEVVGINTLGAGSAGGVPVQGISFAIAIDTALPLAREIIDTGTVAHPYLGITFAPLNPAIASQLGLSVSTGAYVQDVVPASPAAEAGLQGGDIIESVEGTTLEGESDLPAALNDLNVGDEVDLTVLRGNETVLLTVTLAKSPESSD